MNELKGLLFKGKIYAEDPSKIFVGVVRSIRVKKGNEIYYDVSILHPCDFDTYRYWYDKPLFKAKTIDPYTYAILFFDLNQAVKKFQSYSYLTIFIQKEAFSTYISSRENEVVMWFIELTQ